MEQFCRTLTLTLTLMQPSCKLQYTIYGYSMVLVCLGALRGRLGKQWR